MDPKNTAAPDITPPAEKIPAAGHLPKTARPGAADAKTAGEAKKEPDLPKTAKPGAKKPRRSLPAKAKTALKAVAFVIVLALVLSHVQGVLGLSEQPAYTTIKGLRDEKPASLDALYFGASNVHALWQPAFGWTKSGIAVRSYSLNSMPGVALKNMIIEARKTQPDALCIVNLNSFKKDAVDFVTIHRCVDYMPLSANKLDTITMLTEEAGYEPDSMWEYVFPIIRFHSRWSETKTWDYYRKTSDIQTNRYYGSFLTTSVNLTKHYHTSKVSDESLGETQRGSLKELIAYLKESKARVLFLMVPQALSEKMVTFLNSLKDLVEAEGFPCLDLLNGIEDTHLSLTGDFKDKKHTNVHGAIKFSGCLTDYLVANYGFTDKRGQAGWESWDRVTDYYKEVISPYTLPFEREFAPRSYELAAPAMTLSVEGLSAALSWEPVEGADGYKIYRKTGNGDWTLAGDTDLLTPAFAENGLEAGKRYAYTVVPVTNAGGVTSYGSFSYKGISKTTEGTPASDDPGSGMAFEEP